MSENENTLRLYHMAERKLKPHFKYGKLPITAWRRERDRLEQEHKTEHAELSPIHAEVKSSGRSNTKRSRSSMSRNDRTPLYGKKNRKSNTNSYTNLGGTYEQEETI